MKLLKVCATKFKNCADVFTIDFVARSKKTTEDKEYELQEIADGLYVFNTVAFVGKNASGKTTAIDLLDCCYSIFGDFIISDKPYSLENMYLEMFFYSEGYIYKYATDIDDLQTLKNRVTFSNQVLYRKKYFKSKIKQIYDIEGFENIDMNVMLPDDVSLVFNVLKNKQTRAIYYNCEGCGADTYGQLFKALKLFKISTDVLNSIIKIFDDNIQEITMIDEHNYKVVMKDETKFVSDKELFYLLSSGTTKGILLYTYVVASLENGFDLLIDEVENHFHKTLVENMISLYKDKSINKHNATLIFTTHYCEVLDLFNRQDNIWIASNDGKVGIKNLYDFGIRAELSKSRQFYNDAFKTAVNYDDLMSLKKLLIKKGK